MSRDKIHGGGEWGLKKCLWSPAYKQGPRGGSWLFWNNILQVKQGDIVLHLCGKGPTAAFIGYSIAATDGHETLERPPQPSKWGYATSYFRVLLENFQAFDNSILLENFFLTHEDALKNYIETHSTTPANRFFAYQSHRLQCLNGAYLSKCDYELLALILDDEITPSMLSIRSNNSTSETLRQVKQRIGQTQFSRAVKENYQYKCCFPDCCISDHRFLIGSHIARWVDNPDKRGNTSNGLCLCSMHDKAFETGYFSLDDEFCIILSQKLEIQESEVFQRYIKPYEHRKIKTAQISPDKDSLKEHRFRCKIDTSEKNDIKKFTSNL